MGYTNSLQIMHNDVAFILQDEIPHVTNPFADDAPGLGPKSQYELPDGSYETIPGNSEIHRFVYEHICDVNRILQRMKAGREPDDSKVQKIRDWLPCRTLTEVRGFLGTVGVLQIFVKDYSKLARPLYRMTRKNQIFAWTDEEQNAMDELKQAVIICPALCAIDYASDNEVILAVDSSIIGVGWYIGQEHSDGRRRINRFGSINWNQTQASYSQPKIELYGLFRALHAMRLYLIGVRNLVVEMDAAYIKGMINNPDLQPNATINRWIAGILLFSFKLRHIPAADFRCTDGLSRRRAAEEDPPPDETYEDWVDEMYGFAIEEPVSTYQVAQQSGTPSETATENLFPSTESARRKDSRLDDVTKLITHLTRPDNLSDSGYAKLIRTQRNFLHSNATAGEILVAVLRTGREVFRAHLS
ncbi:hypothetical protein ACEPAF_310 [Sanghuangporus sanghuang]